MSEASAARPLQTTLAWVTDGTTLCRDAIADLSEDAYLVPSLLPGWTRKHVVAHLAANAEALGNLVHWARTGRPTPMYNSPEQRAASITAGAAMDGESLTAWFDSSARKLAGAMAELTDEQWRAEVLTGQGRTVPASEIPWLRSREVMVHAVDLGTGLGFARLPGEFLAALRADVLSKRGAADLPTVHGDPAEVTAYLAGRPYTGVTTSDGSPAKPLPAWL
ncbi:maleylpyruvate isomerase family mycothiol-dependent enzyme [Streptomyces chryseus]